MSSYSNREFPEGRDSTQILRDLMGLLSEAYDEQQSMKIRNRAKDKAAIEAARLSVSLLTTNEFPLCIQNVETVGNFGVDCSFTVGEL